MCLDSAVSKTVGLKECVSFSWQWVRILIKFSFFSFLSIFFSEMHDIILSFMFTRQLYFMHYVKTIYLVKWNSDDVMTSNH